MVADRQVLTARDVAAELQCSESQVYTLVRTGRLNAFKIGSRGVRVTRDALERFMVGGAA